MFAPLGPAGGWLLAGIPRLGRGYCRQRAEQNLLTLLDGYHRSTEFFGLAQCLAGLMGGESERAVAL